MDLLGNLLKIFTGGAEGLGSKVGNVVTTVSVVAAMSPLVMAFFKNREEVLVTVTVGDAAFWGAIIAAQLIIANVSKRGPVQ